MDNFKKMSLFFILLKISWYIVRVFKEKIEKRGVKSMGEDRDMKFHGRWNIFLKIDEYKSIDSKNIICLS